MDAATIKALAQRLDQAERSRTQVRQLSLEHPDITIADGRSVCKYDMRFEFSEDSNLDTTEDTQDLCELGAYTIHE